jgi:Skp family chaperone for outer membrane proteins
MTFRPCLVAVAFAVSISGSLLAQATSKPFATVNGETITEAQVMKAAAADLAELEAKKAQSPATYDRDKLVILHNALDDIIEDKLISAAAARDKTTKEQIIFAEIDSNVATPSAEEVEEFYQANKSRISAPHDQALPLVKQYMIDQQRNQYRNALDYALKKQFPVKVLLDPVRTDIATAGYPSHGRLMLH